MEMRRRLLARALERLEQRVVRLDPDVEMNGAAGGRCVLGDMEGAIESRKIWVIGVGTGFAGRG